MLGGAEQPRPLAPASAPGADKADFSTTSDRRSRSTVVPASRRRLACRRYGVVCVAVEVRQQ
jgi:hypothetical protein